MLAINEFLNMLKTNAHSLSTFKFIRTAISDGLYAVDEKHTSGRVVGTFLALRRIIHTTYVAESSLRLASEYF